MVKSNAAKVIDLEAFRQRKMREERPSEEMPLVSVAAGRTAGENSSAPMHALLVPVWVCWVPIWTPIVG